MWQAPQVLPVQGRDRFFFFFSTDRSGTGCFKLFYTWRETPRKGHAPRLWTYAHRYTQLLAVETGAAELKMTLSQIDKCKVHRLHKTGRSTLLNLLLHTAGSLFITEDWNNPGPNNIKTQQRAVLSCLHSRAKNPRNMQGMKLSCLVVTVCTVSSHGSLSQLEVQ